MKRFFHIYIVDSLRIYFILSQTNGTIFIDPEKMPDLLKLLDKRLSEIDELSLQVPQSKYSFLSMIICLFLFLSA
jgi:hypothetical protein